MWLLYLKCTKSTPDFGSFLTAYLSNTPSHQLLPIKHERACCWCYTQLLRRVLNISWRDHKTNKEVYGEIPPLSNSVRKRRLQFAGHCLRASDQPVSRVLFWTPSEGHSSCGRKPPVTTYPESWQHLKGTLILNPMKFNSSCWINLLGGNL